MNIERARKSSFPYTFYLLFEIETEHIDLLQFKTYYPVPQCHLFVHVHLFFCR